MKCNTKYDTYWSREECDGYKVARLRQQAFSPFVHDCTGNSYIQTFSLFRKQNLSKYLIAPLITNFKSVRHLKDCIVSRELTNLQFNNVWDLNVFYPKPFQSLKKRLHVHPIRKVIFIAIQTYLPTQIVLLKCLFLSCNSAVYHFISFKLRSTIAGVCRLCGVFSESEGLLIRVS